MVIYCTTASTPHEFRLSLIEELRRRQSTARDMAKAAQSAKRKNWEQGRVDCYGDLIEFLSSLEITGSAT